MFYCSTSRCSDYYRGQSEDSEPETIAIQSALQNKTDEWDAYINIHSMNYFISNYNITIK